MQLLSVTCEMDGGATRRIGIVLPDDSSGTHVYLEASRKLRERFGVAEAVREAFVTQRWPTRLPAFS